MKKRLLLFGALAMAMTMTSTLFSNPTGAPNGRTGSPGDGGNTCSTAGCHFGTATALAGAIASNIPAGGYTPGQTYTITVSLNGNANLGFQVSPQNAAGTGLGTLIAGAGSQVNGKYITHTSPQFGQGFWSFQWTAPAAGTGSVTFYGAFAIGRSSTRKGTYVVNEATGAAVAEFRSFSKVNLYPNPADDFVKADFVMNKTAQTTIKLLDIKGREMETLFTGRLESGNQNMTLHFNSAQATGHYFLQIEAEGMVKAYPIFVK